jgi:hypothetical protein
LALIESQVFLCSLSLVQFEMLHVRFPPIICYYFISCTELSELFVGITKLIHLKKLFYLHFGINWNIFLIDRVNGDVRLYHIAGNWDKAKYSLSMSRRESTSMEPLKCSSKFFLIFVCCVCIQIILRIQ